MLTQTLLRTFLAYNHQANAILLCHFAALTPEQGQRATAISHGTALELIRHMVDTLSEEALAETIDVGTAQGGSPRYVRRWQIFLHLVNHSTHQRSELSRYLEACGHPVAERDLDFLNFVVRMESTEC
ncbi:MAG: hypothetical protein R3C14_01125 [Caldilineaceae bacterium]